MTMLRHRTDFADVICLRADHLGTVDPQIRAVHQSLYAGTALGFKTQMEDRIFCRICDLDRQRTPLLRYFISVRRDFLSIRIRQSDAV